MPLATKAQRAKHAALLRKRDLAVDAVFAACDRTDIPFQECFRVAHSDVQNAYWRACSAVDVFETLMIDDGRAYRSVVSGTFLWSR